MIYLSKVLIFLPSLILIVIMICIVSLMTIKYEFNLNTKKDHGDNSSIEKRERNESPAGLRQLDWWENAVIYQVYLRSFKDSDGDGIGDIKGLISKLEHFVDAGVNVIWLSPIFTSPMVDFGYDVSDFYDIHYEYGTMKDFEDLIDKAHRLGIRVLLDYIANHASIESEYFKLSEARHPGYENYFVWGDPRPDPNNGTERLVPSNWITDFGGTLWEWSENRQQYYLHQFTKSQADFNFRDPAVRAELINIFKFWLEKGADGFRLDALPHIFEASPVNGLYPDEPLSGNVYDSPSSKIYLTNRMYTKDLMEIYDVVYEWREFVDRWQNETGADTRLLLAEAYANVSRTMLYYGDGNRNGTHFPFNFDFVSRLSKESNAKDFVYVILHWLVYLPYGRVPNWVLSNHDNPRMASRYGQAMVDGLNCLIMMLPGVACVYQGDEIGMTNGQISWEDTIDIRALLIADKDTYKWFSRDPERTPFHWDNTTSAGFSSNVSSWLPVAADYTTNNLKTQKTADKSHYKVFQALSRLRRQPSLSHGNYHVQALTLNTLILVRYLDGFESYVLLFNVGNFDDKVDLRRETMLKEPLTVLTCSVHSKRKVGDNIPLGHLTLTAGEALVLRMSEHS